MSGCSQLQRYSIQGIDGDDALHPRAMASVEAHTVRCLKADRSRLLAAVDSWAADFLYNSLSEQAMLEGVVPDLMAACPTTRAVLGVYCGVPATGGNDAPALLSGVVLLSAMLRTASKGCLGNWMDFLGDVWASTAVPKIMLKLLTGLGLAADKRTWLASASGVRVPVSAPSPSMSPRVCVRHH